jgi:hypothetical protein
VLAVFCFPWAPLTYPLPYLPSRLLFTLSLETLRLIKRMLETMAPSWFSDGHNRRRSTRKWGWTAAQDFDIICGSVSAEKRYEIQQRFNEPGNPQLRLLLISTRAGSLGTNLVAANRVVIFDANWNPSHDNQALFRTYRYGQERPVYVYRLCHAGVFEEAVYSRGVCLALSFSMSTTSSSSPVSLPLFRCSRIRLQRVSWRGPPSSVTSTPARQRWSGSTSKRM